MMRKRCLACGVALCVLLACTGCTATAWVNHFESWTPQATFDPLPAGITSVAQEDGARLSVDLSTMELIWEKDGAIWKSWAFSKLYPTSTTEKSTDSLFTIHGYLADGSTFTLDSWLDCIYKKQYTASVKEGVLTAVFTAGTISERMLLPEVIRQSSLEEEIVPALSEKDGRRVLQRYALVRPEELAEMDSLERENLIKKYPRVEKEAIYILRGDLTNKERRQLAEYFEEAGYTFAQLDEEHAAIGHESTVDEFPLVELTMEFRLEDGDLVVNMPASAIRYNTSKYVVHRIDFMRSLMAADRGQAESLFYPDGSGAIIDLTEKSYYLGRISKRAYDNEQRLNSLYGDTMIHVPAYGIFKPEAAVLAMIEEGDALAELTADYAGSIQRIYASFIHQEALLSTSEGIDLNYFNTTPPDGNYRIRFCMLADGQADYSAMAAVYRQRLTNSAVWKTKATQVPFVLETLGAVTVREQQGMMTIDKEIALTTYLQAAEMLEALDEQGVSQPILHLTGAVNGGLMNTGISSVKPLPELGGRSAFEDLMDRAAALSASVYPGVNLMTVARDTAGDGFSAYKEAARGVDTRYAGAYVHSLGSRQALKASFHYIVSPFMAAQRLLSVDRAADDLWQGTLAIEQVGGTVYEDYRTNRVINRQEATDILVEAMKQLSGERDLLLTGGNTYVWQVASYLTGVTDTSSLYSDYARTVPFLQLVLHGHVPYTGPSLNLTEDPHTAMLKAIETGSGLTFTVTADNAEKLKNTYLDYYLSVDGDYWLPRMGLYYQEVESALSDVAGEEMLWHGQVAEEVYLTAYANGRQTLVNYGETNVTICGIEVPAGDWCTARLSETVLQSLRGNEKGGALS